MTEIVQKISKPTLPVQRPEAFNGGISVPRKTDHMTPPTPRDNHLEDFTCRQITLDGIIKTVYMAGTRPEVIVMAEMSGISLYVARFTCWVHDTELMVYAPSLSGRDGAVPEADAGAEVFRHTYVSTEFRASTANQSSPVAQWPRYLAWLAHAEYGGPGVGVIGMYFTGNFALTMALKPTVLASALCQPSLPLNALGGIEIASEDVATMCQRLEQEDLTVLAYRFEGDRFCHIKRFTTYAYTLDSRFVSRVLPDSATHPNSPLLFARHVPCPYSVVTAHLIDATSESILTARNKILVFFRQRLD